MIDAGELDRLLHSPSGPVIEDLMRRGRQVLNRAIETCPVETGRMRSDHTMELILSGGSPAVRVGVNTEYAEWVHEGRGPIVPVRAKVLRFRPKGSGVYVFAHRVGPAKAQPWLREALEAANY